MMHLSSLLAFSTLAFSIARTLAATPLLTTSLDARSSSSSNPPTSPAPTFTCPNPNTPAAGAHYHVDVSVDVDAGAGPESKPSPTSNILGSIVPGFNPTSQTSTLATLVPYEGQKVPGKFIVLLKEGVNKAAVVKSVQDRILQPQVSNQSTDIDSPSSPSSPPAPPTPAGAAPNPAKPQSTITYADWTLINAFAGTFTATELDRIRHMAGVDSVHEDGVMTHSAIVKQTNATWGLQRISQTSALTIQNPALWSYTYFYENNYTASNTCSPVDVYVVDTGINIAHVDFQGRAFYGASFPSSLGKEDGNGHGTHVAGTIGGSTFGVAKTSDLIAVKVLADDGSGDVSDIISGLDYVSRRARITRRPSVVNLSLGGGAAQTLDLAVRNLVASNINVAVAAGNDNSDCSNVSPAHVREAITVAASTIADAKASFSNFGAPVDIWAPGQSIISTWIGNSTALRSLSGTSMASPHIAGLIAYLIARGEDATPASISSRLSQLATKGIVSGVPSGTTNALARNDIT